MGERYGYRPAVWVGKPAAALSFVAAGLLLGALGSTYGTIVLLGLLLCVGGDVLLIPHGNQLTFRLGIFSFLMGHVAYATAFVVRGVDLAWAGVVALLALVASLRIMRWLGPHVDAGFVLPVRAYVVTIMVMLVLAAGAAVASGDNRIVLGAAMFVVSDLAVARDRFVQPGFINRAWGLPLYFAAQFVIASTVR